LLQQDIVSVESEKRRGCDGPLLRKMGIEPMTIDLPVNAPVFGWGCIAVVRVIGRPPKEGGKRGGEMDGWMDECTNYRVHL